MKTKLIPLSLLLVNIGIANVGQADEAVPLLNAVADKLRVGSTQAPQPVADSELIVSQLQVLIREKRFTLESDARVSIDAASRGVWVLLSHVRSDDVKNNKALIGEVNSVLSSYITTVSANIDKNWNFPGGSTHSGLYYDDAVSKEKRRVARAEAETISMKNDQQKALVQARSRFAQAIAASVSSPSSPWTKQAALDLFGKDQEVAKLIKQHME